MIANMLCPFQGQEISNVPIEVLRPWYELQMRKRSSSPRREMDHHKPILAAVGKRLREHS